MTRFSKDGRLIIPLIEKGKEKVKTDDSKVRYVVNEAYCPNGCSLIDEKYPINGYPGLRIKFKREGCEGEFVVSAVEGDFEKIILSGNLIKGVKDNLYCPHCGAMFEKLVNCHCHADADMIVIGLTPKLDFNNAISFCNVTGCDNGVFVKSGEVIRRIRLTAM